MIVRAGFISRLLSVTNRLSASCGKTVASALAWPIPAAPSTVSSVASPMMWRMPSRSSRCVVSGSFSTTTTGTSWACSRLATAAPIRP